MIDHMMFLTPEQDGDCVLDVEKYIADEVADAIAGSPDVQTEVGAVIETHDRLIKLVEAGWAFCYLPYQKIFELEPTGELWGICSAVNHEELLAVIESAEKEMKK